MPGIPPKELFYVIMLDDDYKNKPDVYIFRKCETKKDSVVGEPQLSNVLNNVPRSDFNDYDVLKIEEGTYTYSASGSQHKGAAYEFKKKR
ncbi:MAG: hypothetical protein WBD99_08345 [Thermodesulfobacteriota bacterium]